MSKRINKIFSNADKKLVTFVTGGDPDIQTSEKIIKTIINNGADIIEIGMPFSDPMADGPTIELASNRSIKNGTNLDDIFKITNNVRKVNNNIPIILMGYYNVVLHYGINKFLEQCNSNGVDGLIIVDLQPEEDEELFIAMKEFEIDLIRLITPNSTNERIKIITKQASGFLYYVTIAGVTGQKSANIIELKKAINNIRTYSKIPIIAGFGIKNREQVNQITNIADGAVVGSSIVKIIEKNISNKKEMLNLISSFVQELKKGVKS